MISVLLVDQVELIETKEVPDGPDQSHGAFGAVHGQVRGAILSQEETQARKAAQVLPGAGSGKKGGGVAHGLGHTVLANQLLSRLPTIEKVTAKVGPEDETPTSTWEIGAQGLKVAGAGHCVLSH